MAGPPLELPVLVLDPPVRQLLDELGDAPPVDGDRPALEIALKVAPGELGLDDPALLGVDLDGDVRVAVEQAPALLAHDTPEQDAETPIIHPEAEEQERRIGQGPADRQGELEPPPRHIDQEIEMI